MSFIRPEARATMMRWREVWSGIIVMALGFYWITGPAGLLGWVGWAVAPAGVALVIIGLQRARFRRSGQGPGTVQIDEGQVAYFGPLAGGVVALSELEQLIYDPSAKPAHWILHASGQPPLHVPVNADGSDALFDVFAALPGLRTQRMLATMQTKGDHPVVIWQRHGLRPTVQRLH